MGTKPAFSFWINISTVSEVRCDCQGSGLVARIEASILVFDTMQVLYWPVWGQNQFCSFDRRCKTCFDTKPVLYQDRFCSLTHARGQRSSKWAQNGNLLWSWAAQQCSAVNRNLITWIDGYFLGKQKMSWQLPWLFCKQWCISGT